MHQTVVILACLCFFGAGHAAPAGTAVYVSWGDHIVTQSGTAKLDTPERIEAAVEEWKTRFGASEIYWRMSDAFIDRYAVHREGSFPRYFQEVRRIYAACDPPAVAIRAAHARGMRVYAYHTIFDEGSPPEVRYGDSAPFPWQSRFTIKHPEYLVQDATGTQRQWGVMEYAHPEVRRYTLGVFRDFLDRYAFDGVYVCTRTHSRPAESADQFGFSAPVVAQYRRRHGVDIRREEFDRAKWRDLRGEFLTRFFTELRAEMKRRGKRVVVAIPRGDVLGPPYGNMTLPWREWVSGGLVDEVVLGPTSGNWHYPSMKGKDRERGYLASVDEGWGIPPLEEDLRSRYAPLCRKHAVTLRIPAAWDHRVSERLERLGADGAMLDAAGLAHLPVYAWVRAQTALDFADARLSIACRLKLAGPPENGRLVSKYAHELPENAGRGWEVYVDKERRVVFRLNDGETEHALTSRGAVPVGEWVRLACVSEGKGGKMRILFDGKADPAERPAPERLRVVPVDLCIGRYGGGGVFLNACIDDLRLAHSWKPDGEGGAGAVALWRFEDAGGHTESAAGGEGLRAFLAAAGDPRVESAPGRGRALRVGKSQP